MSSVFCIVDDKHIPLYRVMWISNLPHFCGNEDCDVEGRYEIRLEPDPHDRPLEAILTESRLLRCR